MEDRMVLDCGDIKKRLKPFLEDLLAEDEYQAYVAHLNTCKKCRDYVGRFGSLSNQLWELGNIKVPSDFSSTVCFNISEPAVDKPQTPKEKKKKNLIAWIIILTAISAGVFAGVMYFKKDALRKPDGFPTVTTQMIRENNPDGDRESEALFNQLKSIGTSLGVSDKNETPNEPPAPASSASDGSPVKENSAAAPKVAPLHWHFQYSEGSKDSGSTKELQAADLKIQKELKTKEALLAEIGTLKQRAQQVDLGKQYSKEERNAKSSEALQATNELREKQEELEILAGVIRGLEKEKQSAEDLLRRDSGERQRKEADRKGKLSNALAFLSIGPDYQKNGILAFTATGEKNRNALQQILFISSASFNDFTATVPAFLDKEQRVSIYLPDEPDSALHWHATESNAGKKTDLFNTVRELGGSVDYESDGLAVFSVPKAELRNLRARIQAIRMSLTEYGAAGSKDGVLSSGPVTVSVYFTS